MAFVPGLYFKKDEGDLDWKIGTVSIKAEEMIQWLNEQVLNDSGFIETRIELLETKDKSKYYFSVNEWKPEPKEENPDPIIGDDTVPF